MSWKERINQFLHSKTFQYVLLFIILFLSIFAYINPVQASSPYKQRPADVNEFSIENSMVYRQIDINCTIPEGNSFNPENLSWQILKVRYEVTKDAFTSVSSDAASRNDVLLPHGEHIQEFQDEYWWESFSFDPVNSPFYMHPNISNNIFFTSHWSNEHYQFTSLTDTRREWLNFGADKMSGYRYVGTIPSPVQLGVLYCNNHGFTFHNVTDANTQFITGTPLGLRPSFMMEALAEPCEVNYNLSYTNPLLVLQPMNRSANKINFGLLDFSSSQTIAFETLNEENAWVNDGLATLVALAIIGVAAAVCFIVDEITDYLTTKELQEQAFSNGFWLGEVIGGNLAYARGYDDARTLYNLMMENEIRRLGIYWNWTEEELQAALDANSRVNSWVQSNFTNPYTLIPPLGFNPLYSPSQVSVVVWIIVAVIIIAVIGVFGFLVAAKIKKGKKKTNESSGKASVQTFNIGTKTPKVKAKLLTSLNDIFFSGISTGGFGGF